MAEPGAPEDRLVGRLFDVIDIMGLALDKADSIIAVNCGDDTPKSWDRAYRRVQKARSKIVRPSPKILHRKDRSCD